MQEYLRVGVITTTHGVHGEVKVYPTTDDAKRFEDLISKSILFDIKGELTPFTLEGVKYFKNLVILKFEEINDCDLASKYRQTDIYIHREDGLALEEGEYYIADLIGCDVITDKDEKLGKVKDVLQTGANDVYVVNSSKYGEVLIPVIKDCILDVNIYDGVIKVHLLDGLI